LDAGGAVGVGRYQGFVGGLPQEILTWYDVRSDRHLSFEEKERQARLDAVGHLHSLNLTSEQIAAALSLTIEDV
jgi:hypothetical protein